MDIAKVLLIGGGAWVVYHFLSTSTPTALPPVAGGTPPPDGLIAKDTPSPALPAFNMLDAVSQRVVSAAGAGPYTADQWNYFLNRAGLVDSAGKATEAPDPAAVFTQAGWTRETPMTFAQYWGPMAPYLKANLGLSGLGFYGGLAGLVGGRR